MNRRNFMFGSLQAAMLFSPLLLARRAFAQAAPPTRAVFWVMSSGYPDPEAFFPTGSASDFTLAPIMTPLEALKGDMTIIDGVDIRATGPNPLGANHIRSIGKLLTAKDVIAADTDNDAQPGGISIDQLIAKNLNLSTIEALVDFRNNSELRGRPFATGANAAKQPIAQTEVLWDVLFKGSAALQDEVRKARLRARRSVLDGLGSEMTRLRQELTGIERVKLDMHEDAIRRAEQAVATDLQTMPPAACTVPARAPSQEMPAIADTHSDILYAALLCDRVRIAGVKFAFSGYHWRYDWLPNIACDTIHEDVHHRAETRRQDFIDTARWDWEQLGKFVQRLKNTPEGPGTMLDNTLVVALCHFGKHHDLTRIPVVLFGSANGQLTSGRYLKLPAPVYNDQLLTTIAHLMGTPIAGIGDNPTCGPLTM